MLAGRGMLFPDSWAYGDDPREMDEHEQALFEAWVERCACADAEDLDSRTGCSPSCPVHGDPEVIGGR